MSSGIPSHQANVHYTIEYEGFWLYCIDCSWKTCVGVSPVTIARLLQAEEKHHDEILGRA